MPVWAIATFLAVFAFVMLGAAFGFKFLESQRKKKVEAMIGTVSGRAPVMETSILIDPERNESPARRFLHRFNLANRTEVQIQQAGLDWPVARVVSAMGGLAVLGLIAGRFIPVLVFPGLSSLVLGALFGFAPLLYVRMQRARRLNRFEEQFPEALDFMSRSMRAGHAFSVSLEMLADESPEPVGAEFRRVFNEQNLGAPLDTALNNLALRVPLVDMRFFVSCVMLQKETGGNLSEILLKLAYVIRERFRLKGQVQAVSAHGRLTGIILTVMPVVVMLGLFFVAPDYLPSMARDPDGRYLIAGAIAAQLLGYYVIRKIIRIKV